MSDSTRDPDPPWRHLLPGARVYIVCGRDDVLGQILSDPKSGLYVRIIHPFHELVSPPHVHSFGCFLDSTCKFSPELALAELYYLGCFLEGKLDELKADYERWPKRLSHPLSEDGSCTELQDRLRSRIPSHLRETCPIEVIEQVVKGKIDILDGPVMAILDPPFLSTHDRRNPYE